MKTNLSNLPQPGIVLERNALRLEVTRLSNILLQKEQDINLLKSNLSQNLNLESSILQKNNTIHSLQTQLTNKDNSLISSVSQKDNVINDLQNKLINKDKQIKNLEDKLLIVQSNSNSNNNLELNMLKEQLIDKKSIIELIKNDNKAYKIKVEKLKTKLAEYTLNDISITHSEMLNNEIDESVVLSGNVLQSFSIIEENND